MQFADTPEVAMLPAWDELLDDALLHAVFDRLSPASLAIASCTCRRWQKNADAFWDSHLERLEPPGYRHGASWEACRGRPRSYLAWRIAWWGLAGGSPSHPHTHSSGLADAAAAAPVCGATATGGEAVGPITGGPSTSQQPQPQEARLWQDGGLGQPGPSAAGVAAPADPRSSRLPGGQREVALALLRSVRLQPSQLQLVSYPLPSSGVDTGSDPGVCSGRSRPPGHPGQGPRALPHVARMRRVEADLGVQRSAPSNVSVRQPTWSPTGQLLASSLVTGRDHSRTSRPRVYVLLHDRSGRKVLQLQLRNPLAQFYFSWSNCGNYLAMLGSSAGDRRVALRVLDVAACLGPARCPPRVSLVGCGQPLFFHWCPSAPRLFAHVSSESFAVWDAASPGAGFLDGEPETPSDLQPPLQPHHQGQLQPQLQLQAEGQEGLAQGRAVAVGQGGAFRSPPAAHVEWLLPSLPPAGEQEPTWRLILTCRPPRSGCAAPEWFTDHRGRSRLLLPLSACSSSRLQRAAAAALTAAGQRQPPPQTGAAHPPPGGLLDSPFKDGGGEGERNDDPAAAAAAGVTVDLAWGSEWEAAVAVGDAVITELSRGVAEITFTAAALERDMSLLRRWSHQLLALDADSLNGPGGRAERLLTLPQKPGTLPIDLSTGEELQTAVSGDGRLLAWLSGGGLYCKDLKASVQLYGSGRDDGAASLPVGEVGDWIGAGPGEVLAVHPDASGVAVTWQLWPLPSVLQEVVGELAIGHPPGQVRGLQWSPDSSRLIVVLGKTQLRHGRLPGLALHFLVWEFPEERLPGQPGNQGAGAGGSAGHVPPHPSAAGSRPRPGPGPCSLRRPARLYVAPPFATSRGFVSDYLHFLDQYLTGSCPSLSLWAPDSSGFCCTLRMDDSEDEDDMDEEAYQTACICFLPRLHTRERRGAQTGGQKPGAQVRAGSAPLGRRPHPGTHRGSARVATDLAKEEKLPGGSGRGNGHGSGDSRGALDGAAPGPAARPTDVVHGPTATGSIPREAAPGASGGSCGGRVGVDSAGDGGVGVCGVGGGHIGNDVVVEQRPLVITAAAAPGAPPVSGGPHGGAAVGEMVMGHSRVEPAAAAALAGVEAARKAHAQVEEEEEEEKEEEEAIYNVPALGGSVGVVRRCRLERVGRATFAGFARDPVWLRGWGGTER